MGIVVRELLNAKELEGIRLIGSPEGLDNEITGITIIEAPDIVKFIDGGEILLTGLYAFQSTSVEMFRDYIQQIVDKKVSAIMLKRGRKVEEAEAKIRILMEMTEKNRIPLLEVPFEMSFRNILVYVLEHLFNEEVMRLKYFKTSHDTFSALMLSDDAGDDNLGRVLDALEKMIGNPVAVFDQRKNCLAASKDADRTLAIRKNAESYEPEVSSTYPYFRQQSDGQTQYLLTFSANYHEKVWLVITEKNQPFGAMDGIAVESAVSALQYELARRHSIAAVEKKFQNDVMHRLLNGKIRSQEELATQSRQLGISTEGFYRVAVFGMERDGAERGERQDYKNRFHETDLLRDAVSRRVKDAIFEDDLENVTMIQKVDAAQTQREYREQIREVLTGTQREIGEYDRNLHVKAGVGKSVEGLLHIPESYAEAKEAWQYADIAGEITGEGDSGAAFFADLGIFRLFCREKDPEVLAEYIPEGLKALYAYRKPQRDDLVATLKTYLDRNQNLSRTAQALYIHYKTAAYRIEKIRQITGIDFDNPNEVLAYRIGFVVHRIMEKTGQNPE